MKNNFWNRLFHKKELIKEQNKLIQEQKQIVAQEFINAIKIAKDLNSLLNIHKDVYGSGFTKNLGPCQYGMFRCSDIATMMPNQVFLGGIYGLNTKDIPFWEQHRDATFGINGFGIREDYSLYEIVLNQYKNHLISNIVQL